MIETKDIIWQTKLAARIHDPAEKALVLLRDPAGHENGTSMALKRLLGFEEVASENINSDDTDDLSAIIFKKGIPAELYKHIQRADWWAAAADRPQWPMEELTVTTKTGKQKTLKIADWAQVRWTNKPVLIHPLTGDEFDLREHGGLSDTDLKDIKERSFNHFSRLIVALDKQGIAQDWKKILLAFWRFGPELTEEDDFGKLGELWRLLPADTRVPDHSIWDHLDIVSAFAGAFAADPNGDAALLALSIGPVQSFIAVARTTSDLWAGSHLLSRLAWEAMKSVCEMLGPDAILFPRLRSVPQVDLWLRDEMKLPSELFKDCEWTKSGTDSNPLFAAALPNRFVAVVPASQARDFAELAIRTVREWLLQKGLEVVDHLLEQANLKDKNQMRDESVYAYRQMRDQIAGFPEVHWAAVPFSLIQTRNISKQTDLDVSLLSEAMAPFFGVEAGNPCGFLDSDAWKVLRETALIDEKGKKSVFISPNPGVLYPAVHDLADRVLAAAKTVRRFDQIEQKGWRCSLTGETEWLTDNPADLTVPAGKRKSRKDKNFREDEHVETLWTKVADKKPAWAKKGEHLGALTAIKRLWPDMFAKEVGKALGKDVERFVVSTHTMAFAANLELFNQKLSTTDDADGITDYISDDNHVPALPRRLAHLRSLPAAKILAAFDRLQSSDNPEDEKELKKLESKINELIGFRPETYYSLLLMDGDQMGAWLSGGTEYSIAYRESFHPDVRDGFDKHAANQELIRRYGNQKRALSPNRHIAISGALNDFSLTVVRHVVEIEHLGRVIYAGGDDVLAMLPVADLLSAMQRLRLAYSGDDPSHKGGCDPRGLTLQNGFAMLNGRLMRMMGRKATASCGAVVAHHQAPLGAVLRELRAAEQRAKNEGGRDALSLTIVKRSGGALMLTAKWTETALLADMRDFLADPGVSRRAVYHTLEWLNEQELPEPIGDGEMLYKLLAYQLDRQTDKHAKAAKARIPALAQQLTGRTLAQPEDRIKWLRNFLSVAEFLARETRTGGDL